jgi:hypothetical protein
VTTAADTNTACSGIESEASQGEFSIGYNYSFETSGSNVIFTFELLDTDKTGVIAYLWRQSPFQEQAMTSVSGLEFTTTVGGFTNGQNISYACKFAYAGGQVVTKYLSYEVGSTCDSFGIMDQSWAQSVMVYPNPASNRLTIKSLQTPVVKVELFSMLGHKVLELLDGFDRIYVDDLSDGLYFIKVYSDLGSTTRKIIKH